MNSNAASRPPSFNPELVYENADSGGDEDASGSGVGELPAVFIAAAPDVETDSEADDVYACDQCEKAYESRELLERHKKLRHARSRITVFAPQGLVLPDELDYACEHCEKAYETAELLARHMKLRHAAELAAAAGEDRYMEPPSDAGGWRDGDDDDDDDGATALGVDGDDGLPQYAALPVEPTSEFHRCANCGKSYETRELLERHRQLRHEAEEAAKRPHKCTQCEKRYETAALLGRHVELRHAVQARAAAGGRGGGGGGGRGGTPSARARAIDEYDDDLDDDPFDEDYYTSASAAARKRRPSEAAGARGVRSQIEPGQLAGRGRGRGRGGKGRGPAVGLGARSSGASYDEAEMRARRAKASQAAAAFSGRHRPYWMSLVTLIDMTALGFAIFVHGGILPFELNPMLGPDSETLIRLGAKYAPLILPPANEWWRLIVPMFLHVGILHFVFNQFFRLRIGYYLEQQHGVWRIAPVYLLCGLHGNILSSIFLPEQPSVGASSALFGFYGIMLADLLQNWSDIHKPGKSLFFLTFQILISLTIGLLPGIDNFAHIGGLVMGVAAGFVFIPSMSSGLTTKRVLAIAIGGVIVSLLLLVELSVLYSNTDSDEWCDWCSLINCLPVLEWCSGEPLSGIVDLTSPGL